MANVVLSIGCVLVTPWRRYLNQGGLWSSLLVLAVVVVAFAMPATMLLSGGHPPKALVVARTIGVVLLCLALAAAWWTLVASVLEQNLPAAARLVPSHPRRLRLSLLAAWVGFAALAIGALGPLAQAPLLVAGGVGLVLAALTAAVRWRPALYVLSFTPPVLGTLTLESWFPPIGAAARAFWSWSPLLIATVVLALSAVLAAAVIQDGGARHVLAYNERQARSARLRLRASGMQQQLPCDGVFARFTRFRAAPYYWWMDRAIARPGPSTLPRVMLTLGPTDRKSVV